jgi:exopolysaccharide biosynthesis polyprenyl glycosylphosphotransferase
VAPSPSSVGEAAQAPSLIPQLGALPTEIEGAEPPAPALTQPPAPALTIEVGGSSWSQPRVLVDCAMVLLCLITATLIRPHAYVGTHRLLLGLFAIVAFGTLYGARRAYDRLRDSAIDTILRALRVTSLASMVMLAAVSIIGIGHPLALTLPLGLSAFVYLCSADLILLLLRSRAIRTGARSTPTLIVGAGAIGSQIVHRLMSEPRYGLRPVAFVDGDPLPRPDAPEESDLPLFGQPDDLAAAIAHTGARHVIFAFSRDPDHVLVEQLRACHELGVAASVVPRMYEAINERTSVDHVGGLPLLIVRPTDPRSWQFTVKHAIDTVIACLALTVLAPLLLAIGAAVRVTSHGPALFRQRRVGRDGREFDLLKFRTMRQSALPEAFEPPDGCAPGGIEGEDRRTALGHFLRATSLDELPQLINVLRGDMSLVGPRPERPEYVERFTRDVARYERRHRVKSGITGWAQVNGLRGQTSIADRVEWDNYYIENWSLWLDLRILLMTVATVLRLRGDT